jgi:hypothetical protein
VNIARTCDQLADCLVVDYDINEQFSRVRTFLIGHCRSIVSSIRNQHTYFYGLIGIKNSSSSENVNYQHTLSIV